MEKKKKVLIIGILVILIAVIVGGSIFWKKDSEYMNYSEFNKNVENGLVKSAIIGEKNVEFRINNSEKTYFTNNPESNNFKEYLLLNNVDVEDDINYIFIIDLSFYLIFFAVFGFAVFKLVQMRGATFKVIKHNNTRFSDIAGLDELKKDMLQAVDILKNPKKYEDKGVRAPKGIMLEGNPGNGKTLFAKALAGEANINFIPTKATDFQSAMMSIGPAKIKTLFKKARKHAPCIIFIDEFDGIGERRNYSGTGIDKENNRIITAMLNEMDGFETKAGVMVIAATNSYNSLDPALVRAGRFDKKYEVSNPDQKTRVELIEIYTKKKKIIEQISKEKLAENFNGMSCSQIEAILNEAATISIINNHEYIVEEDIIGAIKKICNVKIVRLRLT